MMKAGDRMPAFVSCRLSQSLNSSLSLDLFNVLQILSPIH